MRRTEFYTLTPRQFAPLLDRLEDRWKREYAPFACLRSDIANACGGKTQPQDFIPGANKPKHISGNEAVVLFAALGAKIG